MRSLNFHELHVPKGPNLFFLSVGAVACFLLALAVYVVVAFGGGAEYARQLGGETTLVVLIVGTVLFAVAAFITRPEE